MPTYTHVTQKKISIQRTHTLVRVSHKPNHRHTILCTLSSRLASCKPKRPHHEYYVNIKGLVLIKTQLIILRKKKERRGRFMSQQQFQLEGFDQGQPQAGCNCLSPWRVGYDGACNIVFLHVQCNLMGLLYNLHGNIWSTPCGMEFHLHSPVSPKHIKIDKFPTPIDSLIPIVAFLSVTSKVALSTFSSN